jgi:hypothetical protein
MARHETTRGWHRFRWHREPGVARRYRAGLDPSLDARVRDELGIIVDRRSDCG